MVELLPAARSALALFAMANTLLVCHELGHFLAARAFGVHARRFVIGFGPTLIRRNDRRGTEWTLSLLPVGGFVAFGGGPIPDQPNPYDLLNAWARIAVIAAGPLSNIVLAVMTFAVMLGVAGEPTFLPVASSIVSGSAAERAGFEPGDQVVMIDGRPVETFEDMRPVLRSGAGKVIYVTVKRRDQVVELYPELGSAEEGGRTIGVLGIRSHAVERKPLGPVDAIAKAVQKSWHVAADTLAGLRQLAAGGNGADSVAGVIGVAQITSDAANDGMATLLALTAILSVNIALFNLLPIPVLDGGALMLCAAELVRGRPLPARVQYLATGIGIALLATMFAMTTLHDLDGIGLFRWLARL